MDKLEKDGKVGVLVSPGYGAGWYSWNSGNTNILFDPKLIQMVEEKQNTEPTDPRRAEIIKEMHDYALETYSDVYVGGIEDLKVEWIPKDTKFRIDEYDGAETIILQEEDQWITA